MKLLKICLITIFVMVGAIELTSLVCIRYTYCCSDTHAGEMMADTRGTNFIPPVPLYNDPVWMNHFNNVWLLIDGEATVILLAILVGSIGLVRMIFSKPTQLTHAEL